MARLKYNGLTATLGAALTSSDTTITFAAALSHSGGTAVPTISGSDYIPLTILATSDPDSAVSEIVYLTAYTSGATTGTITRAQESTAGVAHSSGVVVVHGPTVADFASAGSGGGILACAATTASATYTTTSTTDSDVDATNLLASFTVPSSGRVLVRQNAAAVFAGTSGAAEWTVRDGTTTVAAASLGPLQTYMRHTAEYVITGLTPGATKTYKWGWRTVTAGTATIYANGASGVNGAAVMTVLALP